MISPIIQTNKAKVRLTYPHLPDFELNMDFNPIIQRFKLTGQFCLLHWQAKPFGLRRWGIYDNKNDEYIATEWNNFCCNTVPQFIQINEQATNTVPTAVVLFPNTEVIKKPYISLESY